jgi:gp16 family phage-associated protein
MTSHAQLKSREEAKKELAYRGISVTAWAKRYGFTADQVRDVLRKERPCNFGASHKIAVLLGIKAGVIDES